MIEQIKQALEAGDRKCVACNGSGVYDSFGSPKCGSCGGIGYIRIGSEDYENWLRYLIGEVERKDKFLKEEQKDLKDMHEEYMKASQKIEELQKALATAKTEVERLTGDKEAAEIAINAWKERTEELRKALEELDSYYDFSEPVVAEDSYTFDDVSGVNEAHARVSVILRSLDRSKP